MCGAGTPAYGSVFHHLDKSTEFYVAAGHLKLRRGYNLASVTHRAVDVPRAALTS